MRTLLILNARIVNENRIQVADLYIRNGRIDRIDGDLSSLKATQTLDIKGKYLLPGMIDDNVHFGESGQTLKGDILSDSRAAVAGGITTYFDMPDSVPFTVNRETLDNKFKLGAQHSTANYSFYLGATGDNLDLIRNLDPNYNCGVKVNMGEMSKNLLLDRPEALERLFRESPTLIAANCEDLPTIIENEESYRQIYGDDIPMVLHPQIRSEAACYKSSSFAIELARQQGTRLHVLQLSTAKEVDLFSDARTVEKRITAEVCYPYLTYTDEDYATKGAIIKCNPAIKSEIDRAGLFQGLLDDHLDNIATGHMPCEWQDKQGDYFSVASGMPLVQCALPALLEHYQDGIFSLEFIVNKTSHAVADLFGIKERGYLREGYWADLVIVDLNHSFTARNEDVLSSCGWTPFAGKEFRSSVYATLVNGELAYINGKVREGIRGKRVEFERDHLR